MREKKSKDGNRYIAEPNVMEERRIKSTCSEIKSRDRREEDDLVSLVHEPWMQKKGC